MEMVHTYLYTLLGLVVCLLYLCQDRLGIHTTKLHQLMEHLVAILYYGQALYHLLVLEVEVSPITLEQQVAIYHAHAAHLVIGKEATCYFTIITLVGCNGGPNRIGSPAVKGTLVTIDSCFVVVGLPTPSRVNDHALIFAV